MSDPSLDYDRESGGQRAWTWAIGLPYRVLASPMNGAVMPENPTLVRPELGQFEHQLGYFACLQAFLTYSFGWTRHDTGLAHWYDSGKQLDDPRFRLINDVWEADGTLLGYLAWCVAGQPERPSYPLLERWANSFDPSPPELSDGLRRRCDAALRASPWTGGHDPLHLGMGSHVGAPSAESDAGESNYGAAQRLLELDTKTRSATYISDSVTGWYSGLANLGSQLPALPGKRGWHVEVYVKQYGYLGTYRRSRETGLWFAGGHRNHIIGN